MEKITKKEKIEIIDLWTLFGSELKRLGNMADALEGKMTDAYNETEEGSHEDALYEKIIDDLCELCGDIWEADKIALKYKKD